MADVSDSEHRVKFDDQINRSIKSRPLLIRQNRKKKVLQRQLQHRFTHRYIVCL